METMRYIVWMCLMATLVCGCTRHHRVGEMNEIDSAYFERTTTKNVFTLVLNDGRAFEATRLVIRPDSILCTDAVSGRAIGAASGEVHQIVVFSRSRGAGDGIVGGIGIGILVGGTLGFIAGEDECAGGGSEFNLCFTRAGGAFIGAVLFGLPAAIVGGIVGVSKGSTDYYYPAFPAPADSTSVSRHVQSP